MSWPRCYAETDGCRRQFLLAYIGEDLPEALSRTAVLEHELL